MDALLCCVRRTEIHQRLINVNSNRHTFFNIYNWLWMDIDSQLRYQLNVLTLGLSCRLYPCL